MQIVYLDQNAASFLAKANPEPIWREIREALAEGFCNRKLICPLPFEGVMETAPRPLQHREAIQSLFWQLSEGKAFKPFTVMSNELTLALIRPKLNWSPWVIWEPAWAERENAARKVTTDWKSGKKRMAERMNAFIPSPNVGQMSERDLFHSIAEKRSLWICDDLDSLLAGETREHCLNCPGFVQFLVSANLSPAEVEALKRAVQHHAWAKIPIHTFQILLGAKWEYDSSRGGAADYHPNDEIDRMRGPVALSYADIFFYYRRGHGESL